jgi:hypothetical protein
VSNQPISVFNFPNMEAAGNAEEEEEEEALSSIKNRRVSLCALHGTKFWYW